MRAAILSALLLCFCIFSGSKYSYGFSSKDSAIQSTQKIVKSQHRFTAQPITGISVRKNTRLNDNREDFISVEDDDDLVIARKLSTPVKYILVPDYAALLFNFHNFQKSSLPFCKHLSYTSSYKYILQRALRI